MLVVMHARCGGFDPVLEAVALRSRSAAVPERRGFTGSQSERLGGCQHLLDTTASPDGRDVLVYEIGFSRFSTKSVVMSDTGTSPMIG